MRVPERPVLSLRSWFDERRVPRQLPEPGAVEQPARLGMPRCTRAGSRHMSGPGRPRQMHPMQEHRCAQPQTPLARTGLDRLELSGLV